VAARPAFAPFALGSLLLLGLNFAQLRDIMVNFIE
jgi:hypothetical protein